MAEFILSKLYDRNFMLALFAAIAVAATIISLALPLLERDEMRSRMKSVALERDRLRAQARESFARRQSRPVSLRNEPGRYLKQIVERFDLMRHAGTGEMTAKLRMAGFRGRAPLYVFTFFRLVMPVVMFLAALFYLFAVKDFGLQPPMRLAAAFFAAWFGYKMPGIFLQNTIQKRQQSIKRAFPDALDLMLICVESGMAVENAFRKVATEIGNSSIPLAEELSLTTAELAYLQDRRQAYENLAARTGLEGVRAVCLALIQAEKYGTSLGQSLRVMAQENRDMRMSDAEKKAAALPPQLTVPMILFFLPVLFVVILGPAVIRTFQIVR